MEEGKGFLWLNRTGLMKKMRAPGWQDMLGGNTSAIPFTPQSNNHQEDRRAICYKNVKRQIVIVISLAILSNVIMNVNLEESASMTM